jgi:hypothetical protein
MTCIEAIRQLESPETGTQNEKSLSCVDSLKIGQSRIVVKVSIFVGKRTAVLNS